MKIGIDFGSTYSTIAQYNERTQTVEAFAQSEGESVSIPSVVSVHKSSGQVACGQGAKSRIGKKFVRIFEAFKMLLTSADEAMLASRGYDETYTPREITKLCYEMTFFKGKSQRNLTCQIVQNTKRHLKRAKTVQISGIGHSVIRGLVTTGQWFSASTTVYYRGSPQGRRHSFVVDC